MKRLALVAILTPFLLTGCKRSDGDRLARIGWRVTQKVQSLVPERTPFGGALGIAETSGTEQRVRERFKSDRYLAPQPIEIAVEDATARLSGTVVDAALKRRAVEIAESTIGVDKVVDEIIVAK